MTNEEEATQEKINAVLDAALDDLEDDDDDDGDDNGNNIQEAAAAASVFAKSRPQEESTKMKTTKPIIVQGPMPPPPPSASPISEMGSIDDMMKHLLLQGDGEAQADEFLGRLLQEMQTQIGAAAGGELGNTTTTGNNRDQKTSNQNQKKKTKDSPQKKSSQSTSCTAKKSPSSSPSPGGSSGDIDQAIASLVEGMARQAKMDTDVPPHSAASSSGEDGIMEDELLKTMMNQLLGATGAGEGLGSAGGVNTDALIDGMMEQLLSKDLMYEPIKKVSEKFPAWLAQNKGKLPQPEYEQRSKQYQCFQKLTQMYDTEPENVQSLMLLMQEVQEFGQPPAEIIQDIAPGLELDADGLPKMDGIHNNNTGTMPFPGVGGDDEDCRIM